MFEPAVACSEPSESLARADLHLVSLKPACEDLMMSSKVYGIMAAGQPTLFLGGREEGAAARILRAHDAGIALDSTRSDDGFSMAAMACNARRRAFERRSRSEGMTGYSHELPRKLITKRLAV